MLKNDRMKDLWNKKKDLQYKEKLQCGSNQRLKASPRWLKVLLGKRRRAGIKGCEKLVEQYQDRITAKAEKADEEGSGERRRDGGKNEWVIEAEWKGKRRERENELEELRGGFLSISASFCPISTTLPAVQTPLKPNKAWTQ